MKNPDPPQHADEAYIARAYPYGEKVLLSDESLVDWVDRINRHAYRRSLAARFVAAGPDLKRQLGNT
jgi:hypothetical protein